MLGSITIISVSYLVNCVQGYLSCHGAYIKKIPSFENNGFFIDLLPLVKINVDEVTVIIDLDEVFTYGNTFQTQNEQELRNHHICFHQTNENNDFFNELFSLDTNSF